MEPHDLRATLAHNIRTIAAEQGIALNTLADFAGVSRSQLFNVLGGTSSATLDWIARVSSALEVEPAVLLQQSGGKPRRRARRS